MKNVACVLSLVCALGCTTAVVRPYVGEQPNWPTAGGSVINTGYKLPIFTTLPSAPYEVIAELRIESPFYATPEPGQLPVLIEKTRELGGDAIVLVEPRAFFSASTAAAKAPGGKPTGSTTVANFFNPDAFKGNVSVVAIRWIGNPPEGLPAKYVKQKPVTAPPRVVAVAAEPEKPKEAVAEVKTPAVKANFGPLRPAKEQKREVVAPAESTSTKTATPDPRKAVE